MLADTTLRFLIEQVGGVEGVYHAEGALPEHFVARRAAGNAIEVLGIVAFRASPVWVLSRSRRRAVIGTVFDSL